MTADPNQSTMLGDYQIVSKIAEGGMGTVFKARHCTHGTIVAIKIISKDTAKNPVLLQRFKQEFDAARLIDHPNVVRALEYHAHPQPYIVMEFVDGESVGQRLQRLGRFPEQEAIRLIAQVCEGLQRAHKQGLVHRDIKPDNILITRDGQAKLTDLGLVKDIEADLNLTRTGRGLGTPHYMAPEQFRNAKNVDVRSDIYSLGATLYAMVTGVIPFENTNPLDCWMRKIRNEFAAPRELNPQLSERTDWAIRRAMSAELERRPASCREFLEDLLGQSQRAAGLTGKLGTASAGNEIWYMVYKDENGVTHTVKGTTAGIRRALADSLLGDPNKILISRDKAGPFMPLGSVAEFRDLVVVPATAAAAARRSGVLGKGTGPVSSPTPREDSDPEAVSLGAPPPSDVIGRSASRRGPSPSGRWPAAAGSGPPSGVRPQPSGRMRRPEPPGPRGNEPADPHSETVAYTPPTPPETDRPLLPPQRSPATKRRAAATPSPDPPSPWVRWLGTLLAMVLLAAVTAAVTYALLSR